LNGLVRLKAKNCGFAPAALDKTVDGLVRLKAKNCGFAVAALDKTVERLDALDREFTFAFGGGTIIRGLDGSYLLSRQCQALIVKTLYSKIE